MPQPGISIFTGNCCPGFLPERYLHLSIIIYCQSIHDWLHRQGGKNSTAIQLRQLLRLNLFGVDVHLVNFLQKIKCNTGNAPPARSLSSEHPELMVRATDSDYRHRNTLVHKVPKARALISSTT